ncbi:single-stranded DNA-binding protein [Agrococcus sp. Marseille-Q4369]|uniref:single-stranded DNA-binding protein n=1 Tax=Agrococcus sp. Marseille-Q4369 TaxID=2810513 RepID=UPI001B8C74ED|nr:single-stranded DNA-binding protein [Agrococcus sp. Marseille-Q4369]QUW19034.1 single-stranded DNA-binding protein [Agrococcus sp. Marseille-Q4369]
MSEAISVVGSIGTDPILKSVAGDQVAEFRIGCKSRRKDGDDWVDAHTNWFTVEAWGGFARNVITSVRKGDVVVVLGRLKVDQWESGERRGTSVKIRADHIGHSMRVSPTSRERRPRDDAEQRAAEQPGASLDPMEPSPLEPQEPALAGAGGEQWGAPVIGSETPF